MHKATTINQTISPPIKGGFSDFFYPVVFPFQVKNWLSRMWALPIIAYIPIANLILLRGWRLELVKRMAKGEDNMLPSVNSPVNYIKFFKNGLLLWCMTGLYLGVPFLIIFSTGTGLYGGLFELTQWLYYAMFTGGNGENLSTLLSDNARNAIIRLAIEGVWIVISAPLYRAAMIRYAFTNNLFSFFRFISNTIFIFQQRNLFIKTYLFSFFFKIICVLVTLILAATGIGIALFPLVVLIVYYYSTGYEYGHLAHVVKDLNLIQYLIKK